MKELNGIFAENLSFLRKKANITQLELAEKLNYSDKAVSKWERGEAIPDVSVLLEISLIFGVTVDFLIKEHTEGEKMKVIDKRKRRRGSIVSIITILAYIIVETIVYLALSKSENLVGKIIYCYVFPLPIWAITAIVFSSVWSTKFYRFLSVSFLLATIILDVFLMLLLITGSYYYLIFAIFIPAELINYFSFYLSGNFFKKK